VLLESEEELSALYCSDNGRPNWSIARMLGICILQELRDMDDQSALDSLSFDARWQHALGLEPEEAYLSRRSLVDFRSRLVKVDPEMKMLRSVFNKIGDAAIDDLKISTREQRLDSTIITSNISTFGRLDLFKKTLVKFLNWLSKEQPERFKTLGKPMRNWYRKLDDKGWFGSVAKLKQPKKRELLSTLATWMYEIETRFSPDKAVNSEEPYLLVKRLLAEHCEIATIGDEDIHSGNHDDGDDNDDDGDGAEKIKVRGKVRNPSTSLQSPHDPDAGYSGHKGPGYFAHITETCNNETTEIITDFFVVPASIDMNQDKTAIDNLIAANKQPEFLYEDAGYISGHGLLDAENRGTKLMAPIPLKNQSADAICRDQFQFDGDGYCISCPEGHAPVRHGMRTSSSKPNQALHAFFDADKCDNCKINARCMIRPANNRLGKTCHIEIDPALVAKDRAKAAQDQEWWNRYKIRSGIEATISELKRVTGIGKLRVRRMPRVTLAVGFKVTACNVKRWIAASAKKTDGQSTGTDGDGDTPWEIHSLWVIQNASNRSVASTATQRRSSDYFCIAVVEIF